MYLGLDSQSTSQSGYAKWSGPQFRGGMSNCVEFCTKVIVLEQGRFGCLFSLGISTLQTSPLSVVSSTSKRNFYVIRVVGVQILIKIQQYSWLLI